MPTQTKSDEAISLQHRLLKAVGAAIHDFSLINEGDRILVAVSGGKDSYTLFDLLLRLQRRAPIRFELEAVNLNPGYADYHPEVVQRFIEDQGVRIHMLKAPIEQLVSENIKAGKPACPLCARIRRGVFYTLATEIGCNKLALGHHLDDVLETVLMNLFYAGTLRGMAPLLKRKEGPPTVIRPLCYALEKDISAYAAALAFPTIPCASPNCAAEDRRRQVLKKFLTQLESEHSDIKTHMRRALGNIQADTLFDTSLIAALRGELRSRQMEPALEK